MKKLLLLFIFCISGLFAQPAVTLNGVPNQTLTGISSATRCSFISVSPSTCLVAHNMGCADHCMIGQVIVNPNSLCGTCYSIGTFTTNSFVVTSTQADLTFVVSYAPSPPADFSLTVASPSISPVFQNSPLSTTFVVTATGSGGYATTLTPTLNTTTGITCTFSPSTLIFSGSVATTTATCPATGSSSSNTTTGATNTLTFHATDGTTSHDAAGVSLLVWTSPIQQWLTNNGSSPMPDSSGHTNDLTNTSVTFNNVAGMLTNTPTYNGSSSKSVAANFTQTNFTQTQPFSISIWYKETAGYTNSFTELTGAADFSGSGLGWVLGFSHDPGTNQPILLTYGSSNSKITYFTYDQNGSAVHHLIGTYDGSQTSVGVKMYLDGSPLVQASSSGSIGSSFASNQPVTVGQLSNLGVWQFTGNIADQRIYGYALSTTQVSSIFSQGVF